uniref:XPG N-terminal domain-containing protein n=1 Tax=Timema poppense TaxID=170557 RepID=A0A7R9HDS8_TIMPO|nr:unnamed protein product [Timema poppensis]
MGVHGLWKLVEPSGKTVPLDTLENKVLAIGILYKTTLTSVFMSTWPSSQGGLIELRGPTLTRAYKQVAGCGAKRNISNDRQANVSIWLHQVVKGFQDSRGQALPNSHLLGLFHRVCKLLYYRIQPVFVFDGSVPQLKKQTLITEDEEKNRKIIVPALAKPCPQTPYPSSRRGSMTVTVVMH